MHATCPTRTFLLYVITVLTFGEK